MVCARQIFDADLLLLAMPKTVGRNETAEKPVH